MTEQEFLKLLANYNDENLSDYDLYTIGMAHKDLPLGVKNWNQLNEQLGSPFVTGEAYRSWVRHYTEKLQEVPKSVDVQELTEKLETQAERQRLFDERAAWKKVARDYGRTLQLKEIIEQAIQGLPPYSVYKGDPDIEFNGDADLIVCLNDIHYGLYADNYWNQYNPDIAKQRLQKYLDKIAEKQKLFNSGVCYLVLGGDNVHGAIHYQVALATRENVIKQIMGVSELLCWFIMSLGEMFSHVYGVSIAGNHSRLGKKDESPKGERLDDIVPWYVKARVEQAGMHNITILDNDVDDTISLFSARGFNFAVVHGDYDSPDNITKLLDMIPVSVDTVFMAHRHSNRVTYTHNKRVVMSGSLGAMDDYCIEKRIMGRPQQIICVLRDNGIEEICDIDLS